MTTDKNLSSSDNVIELGASFMTQTLAAQYETYLLQGSDLDHFMDLQAIGQLEAIASGNPHFIKPRAFMDLQAHVRAGMPIIGIRHIPTGQHVAQMLLTDPIRPEARNLDGYPLCPGDRVVQSFYIHPDHRFSALNTAVRNVCHPASLLFAEAATLTHLDGGIRLVAKISEENRPSLKSFERGGFTQTVATGHDPAKGYAVRYVCAQIMRPVAVQPAIADDRMDAPCLM